MPLLPSPASSLNILVPSYTLAHAVPSTWNTFPQSSSPSQFTLQEGQVFPPLRSLPWLPPSWPGSPTSIWNCLFLPVSRIRLWHLKSKDKVLNTYSCLASTTKPYKWQAVNVLCMAEWMNEWMNELLINCKARTGSQAIMAPKHYLLVRIWMCVLHRSIRKHTQAWNILQTILRAFFLSKEMLKSTTPQRKIGWWIWVKG